MQFIQVKNNTTLSELTKLVGSRNVENILHLNDVSRVPNIGKAFADKCAEKIAGAAEVSSARKETLLSTLTGDSDVFETASLMSSSGWKLLDSANTLPGMMKVPDSVTIPDSTSVLGNGTPVGTDVYKKAITNLRQPPHTIDPTIFGGYSSVRTANIINRVSHTSNDGDPMQWFRIPWGEVTLYSSLRDETLEFPVYPTELSDGVRANYSTMPDLLYQYEPWNLYTGSGPRSQSYSFSFHRDMWTGDHRDGKANDLIRGCMANCYPEYKGSAVYTSTVTLYIAGKALISGILTDVTVNWEGPLGLDSWYLYCKLDLSITEVSKQPLSYDVVRRKPLIG